MAKESAGLLFYRISKMELQVLLVHPGGPFWKNKDLGAWTIPKGEPEQGESMIQTAFREVGEELGLKLDFHEQQDQIIQLGSIKQKAGKTIFAWGLKMDINPEKIVSNQFELEWPPRSGRMQTFPEIDRADWFHIEEAKKRINPAQIPFLVELERLVMDSSS